jgi:dihydroorotate dehydrogenase
MIRRLILLLHNLAYKQLTQRILFKMSAGTAHARLLNLLTFADRVGLLLGIARLLRHLTFKRKEVQIGGITLPFPLMLAAGFVKGHGFADEAQALQAVESNKNIIPGWRSVPALLGVVEFGSFTRHPRLGNQGTVMWRDVDNESTQNRIGLKNPGAVAAATFLARKHKYLPKVFGINIAPSPGVSDVQQEITDVCQSMSAFLDRDITPTWFTLNLSCPNTEDDPTGHQTETRTRMVCQAVIAHLAQYENPIPLWVKISPALSQTQYLALMRVFAEVGVSAVIATNTHGEPTPDDPKQNAGVGGGRLHALATTAVAHLRLAQINHNYSVDIIACGGLLDGETYRNFITLGVHVAQYWSALVFRGPLAAPVIESELPKHEARQHTVQYENGSEIITSD